MRYLRQFTRTNDRIYTKSLEKKEHDLLLAKKVLSTMTAISFIANPFGALAASVTNITDVNGKNLNGQGAVTDLYAQKMVDGNKTGVNQFKDFNLKANDIANMYFGKTKDAATASNLVNLVQNKIDISGTVNAIKNNKVGGNLFFLSSQGMAVTGSGVINAGSLTVLTPTADKMKNFTDLLAGSDTAATDTAMQGITNDGQWTAIPVNASGTISILGKVHTTDGINMRAAHINIGTSEDGKTVNKEALLKTGVTDFSDLVNITSNGSVVTNAGLGKNLTVSKTKTGDIVLSAIATERNAKDSIFDGSTTDNNMVHASVVNKGSVTAAGNVDISATASSGAEYEKYFTDEGGTTADELAVWGQIVKTKADVAIDGNVTGQHVDIAANSENSFISAGKIDADLGKINAAIGTVTVNMDGAYAVLGGEANVTIGKDAAVEATAADTVDTTGKVTEKALNISAQSTVKAGVGASTSAIKFANIKHSGVVPAAAAAYAKTTNTANVTVAGTVKSAGSAAVAADAQTRLEAAAVDQTTQVGGNVNDTTAINAAIVIADGSNSSKVEFADTAKATEISGDLDIGAASINSVDTQALIKGKESSIAATAVNVTNYAGTADVKIDTALKASDVSIHAANTMLDNHVIADNAVGSSAIMTKVVNHASGSLSAGTVKGFIGKLKDKIMPPSGDTTAEFWNDIGQKLSLGASVAVADETNGAHVTLTKNAQITAADSAGKKGDISIAANNTIADTQMQATGATSNYSDSTSAKVLINASVLYADMDSDASVVLEGGESANGKHAALDGANVTVRANSSFEYNRVNKMLGDVLNLCEQLKNAYASNATYKAHVTDLQTKADNYRNAMSDPDYADSLEGNQAAMELAAAAQVVASDATTSEGSVAEQVKDIFVGPLSVVGAATQFANPANYANFQASSGTGGKSGDDAAALALAGSVNINKISNKANVLIGQNSSITGSGKVDLKATAAQQDVAITGKIGLTGGANTAVGGSVSIHDGNVDSLVAVAGGASVAGSAITVAALNDVSHTGITISAGKGNDTGISGMVSYMAGDSNSIVAIDDDADLKAKETATVSKEEGKEADDIVKEAGVNDGSIHIDAQNTTVITNIAGGAALGQTAGVGVSVAITDYDVNNIASVADIGSDAVRDGDDEVNQLVTLVHDGSGLDAVSRAALFGSKTADTGSVGQISAHTLHVNALNDSVINTVAVAGGVVTGDNGPEPGMGDKIGTFIDNKTNSLFNKFNAADSKVNKLLTKKTDIVPDLPTGMKPSNKNEGQALPSLTVAGAGSVSVNTVDVSTATVLDGANITLHKAVLDRTQENSAVTAKTEDASFIGAWGGAAGISWKNMTNAQDQNNNSVGLAGTVSVNKTSSNAVALIKDSTFKGASAITNTAQKDGALVAAGLGLAFQKLGNTSKGTAFSGAASVSVNAADNTVHAVMANNNVNVYQAGEQPDDIKTVLTNNAYDNDTQVTGGVNASLVMGGNKGVAVGGTVTYAALNNDVKSQIKGGTYKSIGTADIKAVTDITQVGAAAGVAISAGAGQQTGYGFEGVAAVNELNNTASATVEGGAVMTVDKLNVSAYDSDLGAKKYDDYINARNLDATGTTYIDNVRDTADGLHDEDGDLKIGQTGNTIVTAALGITATGSKGGGSSAAISVSDINNDFNAAVTDSTITAKGVTPPAGTADDTPDVNVFAKSDTLLIGVAAGVGAAPKGSFAGAGSLTWQTLTNDTTASIGTSAIHADRVNVNAVNGALGVNVAGQVSVGKTALGLAIGYNLLENTTGAYIKGSTLDAASKNEATDVTVEAENGSKIYAIGAGVGISTDTAAANGTIAINRGHNNTEAIIDSAAKGGTEIKTAITNAGTLHVNALDNNGLFALAGGVGVSKSAAVGGSVAYNEVGELSTLADPKKQTAKAEINHSDITTADGASVNVSAKDTSDLTTIGVGVGVATGGVAVQGAAAVAQVNKQASASMTGTTIHSQTSGAAGNADVDVSASSESETTSSASIAAVGKNAAIGAGISVNQTQADVNAYVSGGSQAVKDLSVQAASKAAIDNYGVGGGVAAQGASINGSVAVNQINNHVTARILDGASVTAEHNAVIHAASDELISNYAGSLSVSVQGAAVGASVSVNTIGGSTAAAIEGGNTSVTAKGQGDAAKVKDTVDDENIIGDDIVDSELFQNQTSLADKRKESAYKGVAVSASSTHTIKSFLINAGVAVQGAAVNGTVNVNSIKGDTTAAIRDAAINSAGAKNNVAVTAHDYTNSSGLVGTANVSVQGAAVGLGSDTNTMGRTTRAEITGAEQKDVPIYADALNVSADAKQGISSLTAGVSASAMGAGVSNSTSVALMQSVTEASVDEAAITAKTLDVAADHHGKINTAAIAIGGSGAGAGVGVGVSVLNENSQVKAALTDTDVTYAADAGATNISAGNETDVTYQLYNFGGAVAGVAGSVGVANVNSIVDTTVKNTSLGSAGAAGTQAGSIGVTSSNDIDFNENAGTGAAGAVGIGVGVSVNTIDSQVKTNVENSKLYAQGAVNISAEEKRDVEQLSVNAAAGAIAGGANVMITNVGKEVSAAYGAAGGGNVDVNTIYQEANDAVNGNRLSSEYTLGGMSDTDAEAAAGDGSAGKGGTQESIVKTTVNGATIQAGGKASISAVEETNVAALGINAQAGLAGAVSGAVGILNVHRNSGVELTSADIDAGEVEIKALQKGVSSLQMYQGTVGGYASIGAAYGSVNTEGKGGIGIGNSQITSQENMTITAADQSSTLVDAVGVAIAAGGSASVLVAEGENNGKVTIKSDQSILQAGENLSVTAERKAKDAKGSDTDSLSVRSIAASGGLVFAGAGVAAMANEFGTVGVDITGGSKLSAAKNLTLHANNDPRIKAQTGAVGVSLLASAAVTVAEANIGSEEDEKHLKTYVNVSDGNTFAAGSEKQAGTVEFKAAVNAGQTVDMGAISIGAGSVQVNTGGADVYSDVDVTVGNHTIYTSTDGKRNVDVIMEGSNTTAQDVDANGINVGGLLATGTNLAQSNVHFKTNVQALGASTGSHIGNLSVKGRSYAKIAADAKGYGAALIDISPYAAKVDNNYTADTDVTLKGNWTTAGKVEAQALNGMDIDVTSDAVRAAIVGGSGVWLRNTINNAAHITLDGAIINSGGAQDYLAKNTADYNGNINAGGYGGIDVNAADLKDDIDFTAGVTATNGTHLHGTGDSGSVSLRALTAGTINSKNNLKSAGLIPISLAFSDHAIDYSNTISVEGSSEITTAQKDQNITLSASDDTDVRLQTIADTQGGVVGAASAEAKNTINRGNHIHAAAGSMLESTNDVNLYAGADSSGIQSELGLEILADAYNKTVLPVFTKPKVTNTMTQQNQVELGGDVSSVRHINAKAGKGVTTVTESAKEYNIYDGTSGSGSVASTALGETIGSETATNYVNVTGTAKSGIHNKLTINIGGSTTTTAPTYKADGTIDKEGSVDYDTITITAADGSDWFDTDSIKIDNLDIVNGMIGRYNEIRDLMQQYNSGSKEYNAYKAEMNLLVLEMKKAGLVALDKDGNQTDIPVSKAVIGAITLPEIVVSGGNINIDADALKGTGKINAQGAPQLTITNSSDLYVKVNDLTIKDAGGQIKFNGSDLTKGSTGNSFSGNFHADGLSEQVPSITIHGMSPSTFTGNTFAQADIGIVGDITNTTGNVVISNDNYNIVAQGKISGRNITLSAAKGSVTQTSSDGLANIGVDPVTQYQFSEAVAKKIQTFLYKKGQSGTQNFDNYQTYLNWLVNVVGIGLDELGIAPKADYIQYDNAALVAAIKADYPKYTDQQIQNFIAAKKQNVPDWEGYLTSKKVTWLYNLSSVGDKLVDKSAGIQAGNNVYINAVNVNIGGLVQSGYGSYTTTLNDADKAKVATMDASWAANRRSLSDNEVMTNNAYLVNGGGATWNDKTGVWDYEVKVYYNPSTKQLLTEKIAPDGGKIYITGKISSTGNGRIMAMDGAADIGIDTAAVERNVKVNAIANNDITGLISITDKNKNLVTEYKNGETRSYAVGTQTAALPEWSAGNSSYTYNPQSGTQYAWTGGISGSVLKKYQYSEDFLFWGALDYGKTDDFVAGLNQAGKHYDSTPVSSSGGSLKEGSLVTGGGNGKKLTISWDYTHTDNEKYSEVVADKQYDGFWGKVFGYGTTTYTWTGSQGDKMSSSTGLKADEGIQIGFLGNGNGSGNISVTSKNDMLLAGNISNATILDANSDFIGKGAVNLTSQAGRIDSMGGVLINSDDVRIQAATGVNVNHAAIGSKAAVDVTAAAGDIQFASTKGDLHIKQLITGGTQAIAASTGNISLAAEGSILNDASGTYAVKGKRIDLASKTGSIGTKEKAFTVLGGSDLYSSDTMASSVSAKADGDVVLTQTEGNMRLGTIESVSSDAVLTVNNGSFVDAYNDGGSGYSDTDGKVQNWIDNGIISTNDADDSSTDSAAQAKADRLEALEGRAQTLAGGDDDKVTAYKDAANAYTSELADTDSDLYKAQQTYQNAVTSITGDSSLDDKTQQAQVQEAYAAYGKAKESYFKSKGFSADEQSLIASYGEVNSSNSYGWSKNQLLYAIQDSVLNSTPGQVTTVDYANVTANNITLHAAKGGVGIDSTAKTIHYGDMTKLENLKVLAASKAGDLTWDDKAGTVTVRQQQAINLNVKNNGQTMVTGRDNVYLAGVKDTTFNITGIETANDIKLMSDNGVYMAGDGVLKGKNLIIYGGDGNIGAADHHVVTEITGALDANSAESVYLTQRDGVLTIQSVAAGKDAVLDAAKGMVMTTVAGKTGGYITAGHQIDLSAAAGALGIDGDGIRINNNKAVVNTASKDNTYLFGKGENGTLLLGSVTSGGKLDVDSEGSVALGREEKRDEGGTVITEAVQGDIHAVGSADITAENNITLGTSGVNVTGENSRVSLTATGSISQDEKAAGIHAVNLALASDRYQKLVSTKNSVSKVTISGRTGNTIANGVSFVSDSGSGLTVGLSDILVTDGNVELTNLAADGALKVTGTVTATHTEGSAAPTDIIMTSEGSLTNADVLDSAGKIHLTAAGDILQQSEVKAGQEVVFQSHTGGITVGDGTPQSGTITAGTFAGLSTQQGNIVINGNVNAGDYVQAVTGSGSIILNGAITGGTFVKASATEGDVAIKGSIKSQNGDTMLMASDANRVDGKGNITVDGTITSSKDVHAVTDNGTIIIGTNQNNGTITAGKLAQLQTTNGDILIHGLVDTQTGAAAEAVQSGSITINGDMKAAASGDVSAITKSGDILINGTAAANAGNVTAQSGGGTITVNGSMTSNQNGDVSAMTQDGDVLINGSVTAVKGNVTAKSANGNVTIGTAAKDGIVMAGLASALESVNGDVTVYGNVTGGTSVTGAATEGNVNISGSIESQNGDTMLTASDANRVDGKGNITVDGTITSSKDVHAVTDNGTIIIGTNQNNGTITAGKLAQLQTTNGDILIHGLVDTQTGAAAEAVQSGSITINGDMKAAASGDVSAITKRGDILINGTAAANAGNVTAQSGGGTITVNGSMTSNQNGDVSAMTQDGDVLINGSVTAVKGNVTAKSANGNVTIGTAAKAGTVTAGLAAALESVNGDVTVYGNVTGGTSVTGAATEGNVNISGSIESQNGDTMLTASDANGVDDKGNITVDGTIMSAKDVHAITDDGDILINGNVAADQNVSAQTDTGMIDFGGTVAAQAGNINANVTKAGAIVFSKDASAGTDIQAVNQNGSITFNGTSVAAGRDILARTADKGDIFFKGMSSAGRNITAQTDSNGSITFNGAATAVNTISAAAQQDGGITLRQNITAGNDLDLHTNKGTILFEGNNPAAGEDVIATAQNGNIKITVDTKGDVRDSHRSINGDRAFLRAENGNVTIDHRGVGDVDLYEVYAKDDARISLKDGDLHLGTVNGDLVAILVKNPNKDMDVEHIVAGTEILVSGADMDLEDIEQRLGSDGMLIITPNGASDDVPIDKLHIGNIRTNGGVRFKHLWLNSGDITVSKGNFFLDKLYILDKATFSNGVMKTNIFGTAPQRDESVQNTYWNNTAINNPKEDLENWLSDSRSSKWAYLNFYGQNNVQFSNGHLLDLTDHYHVYRQRYTQADWMRIFTDPDFYNAYETYYHPELSYHDRYGLVDTKYEAGQNASAQELTVEK